MPHSNRTKPSGTYLTHLFGRGLEADRRFIVERFRALTNGEIRPMLAEAVELVSHAGIRAMRPARNEVIICTARDDSDSGVQFWGSLATGLFFPHGRKL